MEQSDSKKQTVVTLAVLLVIVLIVVGAVAFSKKHTSTAQIQPDHVGKRRRANLP